MSNFGENFHAGYYYLLKELAKKDEVLSYSNFATRRKLLPFSSEVGLMNNLNWKAGRLWYKLSKRYFARKRVAEIKEVVATYDPDVVLVMHNGFFDQIGYRDCSFISSPKVYLIADMHLFEGKHVQYINKSNFDLVLFVYKWWKDRVEHKVSAKVGWLPHSVNTKVFRDYEEKCFDVVSCGHSLARYYPLRHKINEVLRQIKDVSFSNPQHPQLLMNRPVFNPDLSKYLIRENYAKFVSQGKIFIFDGGAVNYPVAKYVESMACGSLALAPKPKDADELGFVAGENFVEINNVNFVERIRYYLKHEKERQVIVDNARELVVERHSTEKRTDELMTFLHDL